jgi:hypothetical protein
MPWESESTLAPLVTMGGYTLADSQKSMINTSKKRQISEEELKTI